MYICSQNFVNNDVQQSAYRYIFVIYWNFETLGHFILPHPLLPFGLSETCSYNLTIGIYMVETLCMCCKTGKHTFTNVYASFRIHIQMFHVFYAQFCGYMWWQFIGFHSASMNQERYPTWLNLCGVWWIAKLKCHWWERMSNESDLHE